MITVFTPNCNTISQKTYDKLISSLEFVQLSCTCGRTGCLTKHGRYTRRIKCSAGIIAVRILRVRCGSCERTHALLPSCIVPYSRILPEDQLRIISSESERNARTRILQSIPDMEESNVSQIIARYRKFWKQRLLSEGISLAPSHQLILKCFCAFQRQFMQIRSGINILKILPT